MKAFNDVIIIIIVGAFLLINLYIAYEDYRLRKIRNKHLFLLSMLLPFFYVIFALQIDLLFMTYFFIVFVLLLALYYGGLMPPGDVKYILILTLFANKGIPIFFGAIGLVLLLKILFNYMYFLGVKWGMIMNPLALNKIIRSSSLLKVFISFVVFFLVTNILNAYVVIYYNFIFLDMKYKILYIFGLMFIFFLLNKAYVNFLKKINIKIQSPFVLTGIAYLLLFLLAIINYLLFKKGVIIFAYTDIYRRFLLFLVTNFVIKSFILMLKQNEEKIISVHDLKEGDVVDKKFLQHIFGQYKSIIDYLVEQGVIRGKSFFDNFKNPISLQTRDKILTIYRLVNEKNEKEDNGYTFTDQIKIFNIFGFGAYIFGAYILYALYVII